MQVDASLVSLATSTGRYYQTFHTLLWLERHWLREHRPVTTFVNQTKTLLDFTGELYCFLRTQLLYAGHVHDDVIDVAIQHKVPDEYRGDICLKCAMSSYSQFLTAFTSFTDECVTQGVCGVAA